MFRIAFLLSFLFYVGMTAAFAEGKKPSISAEDFGRLGNLSNISLSPNGLRVASMRNYQGKSSLVIQSFDPKDEKKLSITEFSEGSFNWFHWKDNDRLVVSVRFGARRYGNKSTETRLVAMDWTQENTINLVNRQRRKGLKISNRWVSQFQDDVVSFLPDDPDHILLALDGDEINYPSVYKVNIHTGDRRRVLKTRSKVTDWMADKKGVVRLGISKYKTRNRLIYRESEEDSWKTIARYDVIEDDLPFWPEGFSPDPKIIYVSKQDEKGFQAYYTYDLEKGEFLEKIAGVDGADVTDIDIDEDGNIRSYSYFNEFSHRVYNDKLWQSLSRFMAQSFPDQLAYVASYSKDKKKFIIKVTSPTNPGDYHFLDLNEKTLSWFGEVYPDVDKERLSPMTSVSYKARDGLDIPAYLSLPKGATTSKNLPTVIMPHGGPFLRDYYGYDYWVQFLTTRGYAVLQMNYRGSTGYGTAFGELGHNEWGGKMLDDINDGTRWMIEQGYSDPKRICIVGGSYGGYAALQTLVKEPGLYKCSVAFAPVTSMGKLFADMNKYLFVKERNAPYIRPDEMSLSDISPYNNIDKINVPVLVLHGTEDRSVDYEHGKMFADRMKREKKNIRFIKQEDGDHHLSIEEHRIQFLQELEKFLKKYL